MQLKRPQQQLKVAAPATEAVAPEAVENSPVAAETAVWILKQQLQQLKNKTNF
jgi:hypothetical protein